MDDTELDTFVGGAVYYRGPIGFLAELLEEGGVETRTGAHRRGPSARAATARRPAASPAALLGVMKGRRTG